MSPVGVVSALSPEGYCLTGEWVPVGGRAPLPKGTGWLAVSGVGPGRAQKAVEPLIVAGATALVSWGFAGGLDPRLAPGTLILPESIAASPQGRIDLAWRQEVIAALDGRLPIIGGALAHAQRALVSPSEKAVLARKTGAVAVDQESAILAREADRIGVPFLALRAILDPAGQALPYRVTEKADSLGEVPTRWLVGELFRHPGELRPFMALLKPFGRARRRLHSVARLADPIFQAPSPPAKSHLI